MGRRLAVAIPEARDKAVAGPAGGQTGGGDTFLALPVSMHRVAPAHVLAPAATADFSAPVHDAVSGMRALPHPSHARMGRVGRRLT
jgi:hypothetical protein